MSKLKAGLSYAGFYSAIGLKPLFISCGIPRSGSTLLYNIIRLILEQKSDLALSGGWFDDFNEWGKNGDAYIVKSHHLSSHMKYRANKVFFSYRDIRETIVSAKRKFNSTPSIEMARNQVNLYYKAKMYADKMISYERLTKDTMDIVNSISKEMKVDVNADEIVESLKGISAVGKGYSKVTLLHNNHATGTKLDDVRNELGEKLYMQINSEFKDWFAETGYPLSV